jgi:hypothetical protein
LAFVDRLVVVTGAVGISSNHHDHAVQLLFCCH